MKEEFKKVSTAKRRSLILQMLDENSEVNIAELSKMFKISEVSIRNDMASLEEKNLLMRVRGGAIKASVISKDIKLSEKNKKNLKEKKAIAKMAASLIKEGDTILIDSGSTTEEVSKQLSNYKSLTIVTYALNIVSQFTDNPNISVIVPGGILRHNSFSLVAISPEQALSGYYCDKLILGVDAIDVTDGIFTPHLEEAKLNREMIGISKEVIIVADSSKFNKRSLSKIVDLSAIHCIVTDSGLAAPMKKSLEDKGVKVLIAQV